MFDPDKYLADLITNCRSAFGERLLYMGLLMGVTFGLFDSGKGGKEDE